MDTSATLEQLTPEQQAALGVFADDYVRFTREHSFEHDASYIGAIGRLYEDLKIDPAEIIWCESPWQFAAMQAITLLLASSDNGQRFAIRLESQLNQPKWRRIWQRLKKHELLFEKLRDECLSPGELNALFNSDKSDGPVRSRAIRGSVFGTDLTSAMSKSLIRFLAEGEKDFNDRLGIQVHLKLRDKLQSKLRARVPEFLRRRFLVPMNLFVEFNPTEEFVAGLDEELKADIEAHLQQIGCIPRSSLFHGLPVTRGETGSAFDSLFHPLEDNLHLIDLPPEFGPRAFSTEHLFDRSSDEIEKPQLMDWLKIRRTILHFAAYEKVCFVVSYPQELKLDENMRLHCASGPAVSFADHTTLYSWHGVNVPAQVLENSGSLSCEQITAEPNVEIRRIMIEKYGLQRFIQESGAVEIDSDECGVLYKKTQSRDEPLVVVKVINSTPEPDGSVREYFLRVPPYINTARAAVAWTFDMRPEDYRPSRQT